MKLKEINIKLLWKMNKKDCKDEKRPSFKLFKEEYKSLLNFDNLNLKIKFTPLRISYEENNSEETYIISGQIFLDSPKDKIELIQYCYKKQFEQNNRG